MKFIYNLLKITVLTSLIVISLTNCSNDSDGASENQMKQSCLDDSGLTEFELTDEAKDSVRGESIDLVVYDAFLAPEGAFERFKTTFPVIEADIAVIYWSYPSSPV